MSQNPFSHPGEPQDLGEAVTPPSQRTSIAAVFSLVSSLICCVPGLGLLGVITGIASLMFIAGAHGRLVGKGMAWTGLIVGALVTALQLGLIIGGMSLGNQMLGHCATLAAAIEKHEYAKARQNLGPTGASVTDEQFDAFRAAYTTETGSYKDMTTSVWELMTGGPTNVQPAMKGMMLPPNTIPMPARFDGGPALMMFQMDTSARPNPGEWLPPFGNIGFRSNTGVEFWLTGPKAPKATGTTKPSDTTPPPPAPTPGGNGG
jgi:hypothetical protein